MENIVAHCKVRAAGEELAVKGGKNHVTFQGDHIECLNMMPVVKLSVNNHALITLYQLYRHTCCIAASIITVHTKSYMLTCVADLRII